MKFYKKFLLTICILFSPCSLGSVEIRSELTDKVGSDFNLYLYSINEDTQVETKAKTINVSVKLYLIENKRNIEQAIKKIKQSLFVKGFVYDLSLTPSLLTVDIQLPIEQLSDLENFLVKYQPDFRSILSKNGWMNVSILGAINAQKVLGFFHANWQPKSEESEVLLNSSALKNIQYANLNIEEGGFYDLLAFLAYCSDVYNLTTNLRVGLENANCFHQSQNIDLNDADLAIYKANLYEQLLVAKTDSREYLKHLSMFATTENVILFNRLEAWLPSASLEKLSHSYNKIITNQIAPISPDSVVSAVLANSNKAVTNKLDLLIESSKSNIQTFIFTINNLKKNCQSNRCKKMLATNNIQFIKGNPSFLITRFSELNNQKLQKDFLDSVLTEVFNLNPWLSSQDIKILASGNSAYISSYLSRYFDSSLKDKKQINLVDLGKNNSELLVSESHIGSLDWASDVLSRYWLGHELTMTCPTAKVQAGILGDFFMDFSRLSIEERRQCFDSVMSFKNNLTEKNFSQAKKSAKSFIHSQIHEPVLNLVFTGYYQLNKPALLLESQLNKLSFDEYKKYIEAISFKINSKKAHFHNK